jgi:hypothetical protein
LYYGSLDIWGDEWLWITDYKSLHSFIFQILVILTLIILGIKGVSEAFSGKVSERYNSLTHAMLALFNELVKKKRDRFHSRAMHLTPKGDIFKAITHPKDQLEFLLDGAKRFFEQGFRIENKNIELTIIEGNDVAGRWSYALRCDKQKIHTKASVLMKDKSTARYCYDSGDSLFIPDIRKGAKEGVFLVTERSGYDREGSIYCRPVRIKVGTVDFSYVFTIAIFGQTICTPYDEEECKACEKILDELGDRVELELYLYSMKLFKDRGLSAA